MDPNEILKLGRQAAEDYSASNSIEDGVNLLQAWVNLDAWLTNGGFTPDDWQSDIDIADWKLAVQNGETTSGFKEWWTQQVENKIIG